MRFVRDSDNDGQEGQKPKRDWLALNEGDQGRSY